MAGTIVFISGNDPSKGLGGHSCLVRTMARTAASLGFEPHIFCVGAKDFVIEVEYGFIHCASTPLRPFRHNMMPLSAHRLASAVVDFLSSESDPHLIHSFSVWSYAGEMAARTLRANGRNVVTVVNAYDTLLNEVRAKLTGMKAGYGLLFRMSQLVEIWWCKWTVDPREKCGYKNCARVFINYDSVKKLLADDYGITAGLCKLPYTSETALLPEPAEIPASITRFRSQGLPLIVTASRHDPRKGLNLFLHALALLHAEGLRFCCCMVGGGELLEAHRRLSRELGLEEMISIEGFVPNSYAYMRHADIFVLPSSEEGSGSLSLIEALQAGVAVAASNVDGIPEDVTDGDNALLVNPGDAEALVSALRRLLTDAPLRERLARRSRETFEEKFSPGLLKDALEKNYAALGFPAAVPAASE